MNKARISVAIAAAISFSQTVSAVEFDGFLTAGFAKHDQTQSNGKKITYLENIKEDVTFIQDSKLGLQITADVAKDMQVVAQLLASAVDNNYSMDVEWAYLDYEASESTSLRAGRIKQPVFLISDYLEVGYAYPWIRPPAEAYSNMPVDSIIGVQLLYQAKIGNMVFGFQPYFGSNTEAVPGLSQVNFFADNYLGMALRLENHFFTMQLSTFQTDVSTIDSNASPQYNSEGTATLSVFSLSWDIANFVGYSEFTTRNIEPDSGNIAGVNDVPFDSLFADQSGYYVTLGYRMGKYLPHITYAAIDSTPSADFACSDTSNLFSCGPNQGARQNSITMGLRYELNDSAALKMEYQIIDLEQNVGNMGLFQPFSTGAPLNIPTALENDKTSLISVAVDVIF